MTPQELLARLIELFPEFRPYWEDPGNSFRNADGTFTVHGAFAELTHFFREQHHRLRVGPIGELGEFVSQCLSSTDEDLNNAAATCFIENIAGEECDRKIALHFTGAARTYWQAWGGRPAPEEGAQADQPDKWQPMSDEIPFLEGIKANPEDSFARQVYADWLEEQGDPRSEYLRADARVHELIRTVGPNEFGTNPKYRQLETTLKKLASELAPEWGRHF